MDNGWRGALAAITIILFAGAIGTGISALVVFTRADGDRETIALNLQTIVWLSSVSGTLLVGAFSMLVVWLAVSAVVREHQKDREHAARLAHHG
jgi:NADH:ubiquinone oxidoreductase subunit 6 (subunit J)